LRLLLQSFLKLCDISFIYNSKDKVSERIISLEFSSYKSFFTPRVKIGFERNG